MANKKATLLPHIDNLDDIEDIDEYTVSDADNSGMTDHDKKAESLVDALKEGGDGFIQIDRQLTGGNSPMEFVDRVPVDKYKDLGELLAYLSTTYGGGDYRIKVYLNGRIRANKLFTLAQKARTDLPHKQNGLEGVMGQLLDRMDRNEQRLLAALNKDTGDAEEKFLGKLALYKELFGGQQSQPQNGLGQITEVLTILQTLGVQIGQQDAGFGDLLEKATPIFEALATRPATPAPVAAQKPPPNPTQQAQQMNGLLFRGYINMIIKAAAKKADPAGYAQIVIDQLPAEILGKYIVDKVALKKIVDDNPNLKPHVDWLFLVVEHIKAQMGLESTVAGEYDADISDAEYTDALTTGEESGNSAGVDKSPE